MPCYITFRVTLRIAMMLPHGVICRRNDLNACFVLPGTHRSARRMRFEVLKPPSTFRQFIICMFYLLKFHTKQDFVFKYILQILLFLLLMPVCREQGKRSHYQFSCRAHAFMSFCRAHNDMALTAGLYMVVWPRYNVFLWIIVCSWKALWL